MFEGLLKKIFSNEKRDINLLPQLENRKLTAKTITLIFFLSFFTITSTIGAFAYKQIKQQEQKNLETKINELETGEWKKVKNTAVLLSSVKTKISNYQKFITEYPPIEKKIELLNQSVPLKVKLLNLSIDNLGKVSAAAICEKPEDINFWKNEMKAKENFKNIKINSITKGLENYSFSISLEIK